MRLQAALGSDRQVEAGKGLFGICNRLEEHRSDLLLFDGLEIAEGPIATIDIPIRMHFGLHGNWAHAADIGLVA